MISLLSFTIIVYSRPVVAGRDWKRVDYLSLPSESVAEERFESETSWIMAHSLCRCTAPGDVRILLSITIPPSPRHEFLNQHIGRNLAQALFGHLQCVRLLIGEPPPSILTFFFEKPLNICMELQRILGHVHRSHRGLLVSPFPCVNWTLPTSKSAFALQGKITSTSMLSFGKALLAQTGGTLAHSLRPAKRTSYTANPKWSDILLEGPGRHTSVYFFSLPLAATCPY